MKGSEKSLVELKGVYKSIEGNSILKDINLKLEKGSIFYTLGYLNKPGSYGLGETLIRCLIYIVLIAIVFFMSVHIFKKSRYEKLGHIATVSGMEKFYQGVISYSISFLVFVLVLVIEGNIRIDWAVLFCIIIPILLYFLLGRIIGRYNSRMS
ncbi:MAG TPA: hypothetical protein PK566_02990 [Pseudobacteroides sp.]|nr:hypothetical protein [Pseudobacteroides sp.]